MRWYEKFNEEGLTYDDGLYEEHGHSLLALFLALLLYALLLACIFLEIPYAITEQVSIIPHGNDLIDQLPRRSTPARVVSLPLPTKKAAPAPRTRAAQPAPAQPSVTPKLAAPKAPVPAAQPRTPATPPISSPAPATAEPAALPAASLPAPALPLLPTRRGQTSWVRKSAQQTVPTDNTPAPIYHGDPLQTGQTRQPSGHTPFSGLENISTQHVSRLPICEDGDNGEPSFGSPLGHGNGRAPSAEKIARNMEFELFATRLVHNVCDTSHQEPFCLAHNPISTHTSVVSITVARNRKITSVHFLQPSPSKALDAYIERIIYTTMAPLLPASWHEETLTLPLSINMRAFPGTGELTLIPSKEG